MRETLPNLGPSTTAMLRRVGITSARQLRELGAARAYAQVKQTSANASFTVLCELEGALTNRSWQEVAEHDRLRLLSEVESAEKWERFRDGASLAVFGASVGATIGFIAWTLEASPWWWAAVPLVAFMASFTGPPPRSGRGDDWGDSDGFSDGGDSGGGGGDSNS